MPPRRNADESSANKAKKSKTQGFAAILDSALEQGAYALEEETALGKYLTEIGSTEGADPRGDQAGINYLLFGCVKANHVDNLLRVLQDPRVKALTPHCKFNRFIMAPSFASYDMDEATDDEDIAGITLLQYAAELGHTECVKVIISEKAGGEKPATSVGTWGFTALHIAAWHCHTEVVELLLRGGAKVNALSMGGYAWQNWCSSVLEATPLHCVFLGLFDRSKKLNADPDRRTQEHRNALECVRILLQSGARINALCGAATVAGTLPYRCGCYAEGPDDRFESLSPLHLATIAAHVEAVELLLEHGAVQTPLGYEGKLNYLNADVKDPEDVDVDDGEDDEAEEGAAAGAAGTSKAKNKNQSASAGGIDVDLPPLQSVGPKKEMQQLLGPILLNDPIFYKGDKTIQPRPFTCSSPAQMARGWLPITIACATEAKCTQGGKDEEAARYNQIAHLLKAALEANAVYTKYPVTPRESRGFIEKDEVEADDETEKAKATMIRLRLELGDLLPLANDLFGHWDIDSDDEDAIDGEGKVDYLPPEYIAMVDAANQDWAMPEAVQEAFMAFAHKVFADFCGMFVSKYLHKDTAYVLLQMAKLWLQPFEVALLQLHIDGATDEEVESQWKALIEANLPDNQLRKYCTKEAEKALVGKVADVTKRFAKQLCSLFVPEIYDGTPTPKEDSLIPKAFLICGATFEYAVAELLELSMNFLSMERKQNFPIEDFFDELPADDESDDDDDEDEAEGEGEGDDQDEAEEQLSEEDKELFAYKKLRRHKKLDKTSFDRNVFQDALSIRPFDVLCSVANDEELRASVMGSWAEQEKLAGINFVKQGWYGDKVMERLAREFFASEEVMGVICEKAVEHRMDVYDFEPVLRALLCNKPADLDLNDAAMFMSGKLEDEDLKVCLRKVMGKYGVVVAGGDPQSKAVAAFETGRLSLLLGRYDAALAMLTKCVEMIGAIEEEGKEWQKQWPSKVLAKQSLAEAMAVTGDVAGSIATFAEAAAMA
eukprot:m.276183 g.276183  ORF g.276183 m.276183 type:complete len:1002 (-) comp15709_c0_seq1:310-3315(-)